MRNVFLCVAVLCSFISYAQQFDIYGTVTDSLTKQPLASATVFLETIQDSTLITYSITNADGQFSLKGNTDNQRLNFFINYQGFKDVSRIINLNGDSREIDLGNIQLVADLQSLDDVVVTARVAPIKVMSDTLEFNAKSFNTKADATLEDVLKELPGVEIDSEGKITVNGKPVNKLLVDGKEFFGDDPQVALKNLPKEIIDKIQVSNSKSEEDKITGDSGDASSSEINITLEEGKNKGFFSRLTAGAGTDDRYSTSGIANYFKDDFRLTVLGSANNINSPGFTYDEIYDALGSQVYTATRSSNGSFGINGINFGSGSDGITESSTGGFNVSNDFGENVETSGNYLYGRTNNFNETSSIRTTFLPDRTFTTISNSDSNNDSDTHNYSANARIKPDTLTTISINTNGSYGSSDNNRNSSSINQDQNGEVINSVITTSNADRFNVTNNSSLYAGRGSINKKHFYSLNLDLDYNDLEETDLFFSSRTSGNDASDVDIQDQRIEIDNLSTNIRATPRYRYKFSEAWSTTVDYRIGYEREENERQVFDQESGSSISNNSLSSDFRINSLTQRPTINLSYRKDDRRISAGIGYFFTNLDSEELVNDIEFDRDFNAVYTDITYYEKLGEFASIWLNVDNNLQIPGIRQLQPVEDRTNPLNIVTGNPNLEASLITNFNLNVNNFNWQERQGWFAGINFSTTQDAVRAITVTDDDLIRRTTYTNVDGNFNGYAYFDYRKSWKKDERTWKAGAGISTSFNRNRSFTNGVLFTSDRTSFRPDFQLSYELDDFIDVEVDYSIGFNNTRYDLSSIEDIEFINHQAGIDFKLYYPKDWTLAIRGEYNLFGNVDPSFDNDSFVVIGSLGYTFAKEKAIISLKAYDLFNQVINTRRVASDDFVLDSSNLALQQYFLLSFTYKLSKFGGKGKREQGGVIFLD
ncbi:outer membrane beta-barrel protein [Nonlabens ponticola]|uniref:TonB-dependent receptor n=1 Tax=Nonlabens ponticola TaxID=2496866 RepID=A0A3S9MWK4_9FLAO|nr:outer membrane beta-barrel protein [Nonlabens ponticola]AZQ43578.1 TonB-dependent receptor [Nonlabens ponticola]